MRIEKKELSQTNMEFKVILEKEEVDKLYNKTVRYFRNKYAIPGFRKGKAPLSMVKKMFKEAIDASFELAAADEYLNQALISEKENPINEPEFVSGEWNDNGEYEMIFKFEKMPEIDIKKYKNLEVEYIEEKVSDDMINNQLKQMQFENSTKVPVNDHIEENYLLDLEFYENEDDKEPVFVLKEVNYFPKAFNDEFNDFIKNAKLNDKIKTKLDLEKIYGEIPNQYKKDKEYIVKIAGINKIELPELNDDFAKDLNFESFEELKKELKKDFQKEIDEKNKEAKITAVKVKIIEENPFEVPKSLVDKYSMELAGSYVRTKEELDKIVPLFNSMAEFNIKNFLIKNDIIKKEKIELTDEDLENYNKKKAKKLSLDLEKFKELYKSSIERDTYKDQALEEKYDDFLLKNNKFIPTEKKEEIQNNEEAVKEEKVNTKETKKETKEEK